VIDDEKSRSGVKTQTRIDGVAGVEAESGVAVAVDLDVAGAWIWNLRTPTFSIRYSSRAEIHFCTLYVLYDGDEADPEEMLRLHFHTRHPSAVASCMPSM
jgi:hypothetical protein